MKTISIFSKIFFLFFIYFGTKLNAQKVDLSSFLYNKANFKTFIETSDDKAKIEAIEFLLDMEGNKKVNPIWRNYTSEEKQLNDNTRMSLEYPNFKYCTQQFVALYLITAIYYSDTEFCEKIEISYLNKENEKILSTNLYGKVRKMVKPFPRKKFLSKTKYRINQYQKSGAPEIRNTYRYHVVDNKIIKEMYKDYKAWFLELKSKGFVNTKPPVLSHSVKWVGN